MVFMGRRGGVMTRSGGQRRARVSHRPLLILLSVVVLLAGVFSLAAANTVHRVTEAGAGSMDGSSWDNAHAGVQAALAAAEPGDEIWVAEGTYKPSVPTGRDATFQLKDGVALYGGFAGNETSLSQSDWVDHVTILSGDIGVEDDSDDNSYHVVKGCDNAVLDGFTITRGHANDVVDYDNIERSFGGGMANFGTSPTVRNCAFFDNAADSGGGMVNFSGNPTVTNCMFEGNTAILYGGGMWSRISSPTMTDCTFSDNDAEHGGGMSNDECSSLRVTDCIFSGNVSEYGGGMDNYDSSPTVTGCVFSANLAGWLNPDGSVGGGEGGGMYNFGGSPALTGCTFEENIAYVDGGGMFNYESDPAVTRCIFSDNVAFNGGGMCNENSSPTVTHCTFSGNELSDDWGPAGAGMYNLDSSPAVTDCTFSGNGVLSADPDTLSRGGGMYNKNGSPTVTDCSFTGNEAYEAGGGMCNEDSSPEVTDCTFSDNDARYDGGGMCNISSSPTVTDCTFSGNGSQYGGGMGNVFSSLTVIDCTFSGNVAQEDGGGMYNYAAYLTVTTVTRCTFSGNTASGSGGGMGNVFSSPTVTDCTFSGNKAEYGGGMYNYYGYVTVTDCTFSGNETVHYGGGMYNEGYTWEGKCPAVIHCTFYANEATYGGGIYSLDTDPYEGTTVKNTILAGNTPDDCSGSSGRTVSRGYNLEGGVSCWCTQPTDQQNTDPLLDPDLRDNGGPTETHALLSGSPALDAIPWPGAPTTDQRGFPRPYPVGGLADIGAVEMQLAYANGDVNGDGTIDLLDVVLCQQIASGLVHGTAAQREAADVNGDGDVDADDVTTLSEYVLGIRTTLP